MAELQKKMMQFQMRMVKVVVAAAYSGPKTNKIIRSPSMTPPTLMGMLQKKTVFRALSKIVMSLDFSWVCDSMREGK